MKIRSIVIGTIVFLIRGLRPWLGIAACHYTLSCSRYTILQFQEQPFHVAIINSIKRIGSCRPRFFGY